MFSEISTFIIAGHETTGYIHTFVPQAGMNLTNSESCRSITVTWALYALTQNKDAQMKLREEISSLSTDNPSMDDLNELLYLDYVVRETLRLHSPVPSVQREAMKDDCIPVSKPFTNKKGVVCNEIR
jgi:cytochrome P450